MAIFRRFTLVALVALASLGTATQTQAEGRCNQPSKVWTVSGLNTLFPGAVVDVNQFAGSFASGIIWPNTSFIINVVNQKGGDLRLLFWSTPASDNCVVPHERNFVTFNLPPGTYDVYATFRNGFNQSVTQRMGTLIVRRVPCPQGCSDGVCDIATDTCSCRPGAENECTATGGTWLSESCTCIPGCPIGCPGDVCDASRGISALEIQCTASGGAWNQSRCDCVPQPVPVPIIPGVL